MKKYTRWIAWMLLACLLAGCGKGTGGTPFWGNSGNEQEKYPQLRTDFTTPANPLQFSAKPSAELTLSENGAAAVLAAVENTQPEYPYTDMYDLPEVKKRLNCVPQVQAHQFSALNSAGKLDASHLAALVKDNNKAFLETKPFGYTAVEEDYIEALCGFIVTVVDMVKQMYPELDWERVHCNLGNLKILYKSGMLSFAQVNDKLVLAISKNNTNIVQTMKGEDGFSRVLTHETMHLLQIGCACEAVKNCSRRAGICYYWEDFTLNTTDWTWMVEGSAERMMCRITGGEAVSYQYKMDYLCSMTMSVLLRDPVQPDTMETMCFYSDPELLFETFGCETEQQREELLNLMITLQVLQMQPNSFMIAYRERTGVDLGTDEEAFNQFCYALKPAICTTIAKEFYENLTTFLQENPVSLNDLFFLLNLFEGHLNPHLTYTNESKREINRPFMQAYIPLRQALFTALEQDNPGLDLASLYEQYEICGKGSNELNGELAMLSEEKRNFLRERALWQQEGLNLGQKIPQSW